MIKINKNGTILKTFLNLVFRKTKIKNNLHTFTKPPIIFQNLLVEKLFHSKKGEKKKRKEIIKIEYFNVKENFCSFKNKIH